MKSNQETDTGAKSVTGIRLNSLNAVMVIIAVFITVLLVYATYASIGSYDGLREATDQYIACQQAAKTFQEGSDYLTNECRFFAVTGDIEHARNFVEEVEVTCRREKAVDDIDHYMVEAQSYQYLIEGLERSNALMEVECYAMRLAADVFGIEESELPDRLREITPTPEDAALDTEPKRARVMYLLFGEEYQESKQLIYESVEKSISALIDDTRTQQIDSLDGLSRILRRQRILIAAMLILLFSNVVLTYFLVIRPLKRSVDQIRAQQQIAVNGSYEMQFLASTYNEMYEQNSQSTEQLTYTATHDSLTGVHNRTAYDALRKTLDESSVGAMIVDVDKFKQYNDTYGHDVGDLVLQRVAKSLVNSFRSEDFISRIGGDEFCVIMMHANSSLRGLVEGKIQRINAQLSEAKDGTPPLSISVGVAFGDRPNPAGDIFKDADTALYQVKREGRGGVGFFE